jgi:hypothetical protein
MIHFYSYFELDHFLSTNFEIISLYSKHLCSSFLVFLSSAVDVVTIRVIIVVLIVVGGLLSSLVFAVITAVMTFYSMAVQRC